MNIHPLKTEPDYDQILARIDALMDAEPGSPKADELDVLVTLVEAYEAKHHPIPPPDPVDVHNPGHCANCEAGGPHSGPDRRGAVGSAVRTSDLPRNRVAGVMIKAAFLHLSIGGDT